MINAAVLNKEEFLSWIARKSNLRTIASSAASIRKQLSSSFCAIAVPRHSWANSESEGNVVIVVHTDHVKEFFAFVSTYVNDYIPFTAFFRVITTEQVDLLSSEPELGERDSRDLLEKLVGTAIVEAAIYVQSAGNTGVDRPLSLPAANATFSAAAIQGIIQNPNADLIEVARGWHALRLAIGGEKLPVEIDELVQFWRTIQQVIEGGYTRLSSEVDHLIVDCTRRSFAIGRIDDTILFDLLSPIPELRGDVSKFGGTRERRAKAIREALVFLNNAKGFNGQFKDCVAGCLLSLLGDGSLRFIPAAISTGSDFHMAPLWFAVWSGLQNANDMLTEFDCLGRRMVRDLRVRKSLFSIPTDDISVVELINVVPNVSKVPRGQGGSISAEIFPGVSSRQGLARVVNSQVNVREEFYREIQELRAMSDHSSAILSRIGAELSRADSVRPEGSSTKVSRPRKKY